jgi:hypothetical protein
MIKLNFGAIEAIWGSGTILIWRGSVLSHHEVDNRTTGYLGTLFL